MSDPSPPPAPDAVTPARPHDARRDEARHLAAIVGGLAHDFGNVMAGIAGHTELLALDVAGNADAEESLRHIQAGLRRARGLVDSVLAFARPRAPERRPLALGALVRETLALHAGRLPDTVGIAVRADDDASVLGDATQLAQVVDQLVTNAVQALDGRAGTITVEVEPETRDATRPPAGRSVCLRVRDDGPGIAPALRDRIFEPFFTTRGSGRGAGLGLAIVHATVTAHDGCIDVDSEPGRGTTIAVHLPAA